MSKKCLIHIMGPTNLLAAIVAVETVNNHKNITTDVILESPGFSKKARKEVYQTVKDLSQKMYIRKIYQVRLNYEELNLDYKEYHEFYYSHDVVSKIKEYVSMINPSIIKICYGDALGYIFDKEHLLWLINNNKPNKYINFVNFIKRLTSFSNSSYPDRAVLILPIDYSGKILHHVPLTVCSKSLTLKVLNRLATSTTSFQSYLDQLTDKYKDRKRYLFLMDIYAECGFIVLNKEISMYCSYIREICPLNSVIFIKSHPGEMLSRFDQIKNRLRDNYTVIKLNPSYNRYPIEMWKNLIKRCITISMSFPILSLKYLYDVDVNNLLNEQMIKKWFKKQYFNYLMDYETFIDKPLKKLKDWNQDSILYSR